jgi:hypothetical protein
MPKKHLLFFITILIHTIHYGQKVWFVTGYDQHFNSNASSIRSNDLFDSIEIKARGIKKAYLFRCSGERDENGEFSSRDTLDIFLFDSTGKANCRIAYPWHQHYISIKRTICNTDEQEGVFSKFLLSKNNPGSIITEFVFESFSDGMDTAFVNTRKYNIKGLLIEERSNPTRKYVKAALCPQGNSYHYQYNYDDSSRPIFYRDFHTAEYKKIFYTFFGSITETYDVKTNTLISKEVTLIQNEPDFISETNIKESITITRHAKNSKLFHRFSITNLGEPSYTLFYEITYD